MQYLLNLIEHKVQDSIVQQRSTDGFINATAMCKAANKAWSDYRRLKQTEDYLNALSADMQKPISELIQSITGGDTYIRCTWVHPDIAIHLSQWLSPDFAVQVSKWVREWLSGYQPKGFSYHLRRYTVNLQRVPYGYFSILQEMMVRLIGPMEARGYILPENLIPDISEGRMFCKFLRDGLGIDTDSLPTYLHIYEDGRMVSAKLYPIDLLPAFLRHFNETWLPNNAVKYFTKRDSKALEYLPYLLPSAA